MLKINEKYKKGKKVKMSSMSKSVIKAITLCGEKYGFNISEALEMLKHSDSKGKSECVLKCSFSLPYNGELNYDCCYALRQNSGLYTQCKTIRNGVNSYCKQCQVLADKTDGVPEYGTIQQRVEVSIFDYVDPKGRKPVAYKISKEEVLEEASKFNINIHDGHFESQIVEKRGRPASKKEDKSVIEKGPKGRPKKEKKVIQIEGDVDDLFAALVADANEQQDTEGIPEASVAAEKEVNVAVEKHPEGKEKTREAKAKASEGKAKAAAEKEAKAREAKAKAAAEKEEKTAKIAAEKEAKKLEKETKKAAESKTKEVTAAAVPAAKPDDEDEQDIVKKIEVDGKKYLKSKKSGIVYDYKEYINNNNQLVIGKWNNTTNKIDFSKSEEEIEEEYDEDDEDDDE